MEPASSYTDERNLPAEEPFTQYGGVLAVGQIFTILGLEGRLMFTLIQLGLQVLVGGMIFITATLLLGMQEVKDIIRILLRRNNAELESIQTA